MSILLARCEVYGSVVMSYWSHAKINAWRQFKTYVRRWVCSSEARSTPFCVTFEAFVAKIKTFDWRN